MLAKGAVLASAVLVLCLRGITSLEDGSGGGGGTVRATTFLLKRGPTPTCYGAPPSAPVATSIATTIATTATGGRPRWRGATAVVTHHRRRQQRRGGAIFTRCVAKGRSQQGDAAIAAMDEGDCDNSIDCDDRRHDDALLTAIARHPPPPGEGEGDDEDAGRIFHGRGGTFLGCEHLTLDWFPPVFVLTSFYQQVSEDDLRRYHEALSERWSMMRRGRPGADDEDATSARNVGPVNWVYQFRRGHASSSDATVTRVMSGSVPDPHVVTERRSRYLVQVGGGYSKRRDRGLFLDMSEGRSWVRRNSRGRKVLNLFAHTCSFSVAAASGGAVEVVNVDMNRGALRIGQRNHELNDRNGATPSDCKVRFLGHNVFKSWGKIRRLGPYGIVVVDPPSHQVGSFVAKRDYAKVIRRLPALLSPGGHAVLCLNAPELDAEFLRGLVAEEAPVLRFVERLESPASFPVADVERGLKVLIYEMPV